MKLKYDVFLPKGLRQLEDFIQRITKKNPVKHYIVRIFPEYITEEELTEILKKYKKDITLFKKNKSLIFWTNLNPDELPEFVSVAPTEEEAIDLIEFEEIERDLLSGME